MNLERLQEGILMKISNSNILSGSVYNCCFKLVCLKIKHDLNHFALKTKVHIRVNMTAMVELQR